MTGFSAQKAFEDVEAMVTSWGLRPYAHHLEMLDESEDSCLISVLFSKPTAYKPIPEYVASLTARVVQGAAGLLTLTYALEGELTERPASERLGARSLDRLIDRKGAVAARAQRYYESGSPPLPRAFVPGEYMAAATLEARPERPTGPVPV